MGGRVSFTLLLLVWVKGFDFMRRVGVEKAGNANMGKPFQTVGWEVGREKVNYFTKCKIKASTCQAGLLRTVPFACVFF